ncbi:MAG: 50S ribosomal protein L10 [Bacilli bacterium]
MNKDVLKAKEAEVARISDEFSSSKCVIVVTYHNLNVSKLSTLRKDLKKVGAKFEVNKNTILRRALNNDALKNFESILVGPNAIITCDDPTAALPVLAKFVTANKAMEVKGAVIDGTFCDAERAMSLASVGTKENSISIFLSVLQSPVTKFAMVLKAYAESLEK